MKRFRSIFDFFLFSNIFISFCSGAMVAETFLLCKTGIHWLYVSFVFLSTLVLYNFPVFTETNFLAEHSPRHKWISENRKIILIISSVAFIPAGILIFFFPMKFVLGFIPVVSIALAYFFPQTHLRGITGVKTFIVAFVWTCVTATFPLLFISDFDFSFLSGGENITMLLQNFFFIFPLCIIYNVRDIEADRKAGIRTFPVVYGVKATIAVCLISLVLFSSLVILSFSFSDVKTGFLFSAVVSAVLLLLASEKRSEYYYTFWIDGMILLKVILLAVSRH